MNILVGSTPCYKVSLPFWGPSAGESLLQTFREGTQLLTSQLDSQMWSPIPPANFGKNAATWHLMRPRETEISLGAWT